MLSDCRKWLHLFNANYIREEQAEIEIEEKSPTGAGKAIFALDGPAVSLRAHNNPPLIWSLKVRNCADGAFITFEAGAAHLHIVELKSRLTQSAWSKASSQIVGMYLSSLAAGRLMNISSFQTVTCYVAFKEDAMNGYRTANPVLLKTAVGLTRQLGEGHSWEQEIMDLPFEAKGKIVKSVRDVNGNSNFGAVH